MFFFPQAVSWCIRSSFASSNFVQALALRHGLHGAGDAVAFRGRRAAWAAGDPPSAGGWRTRPFTRNFRRVCACTRCRWILAGQAHVLDIFANFFGIIDWTCDVKWIFRVFMMTCFGAWPEHLWKDSLEVIARPPSYDLKWHAGFPQKRFWGDMGDLTSQVEGAPGIQGVHVLADQHPALDPMVFNFDVYLPSGKHVHVVVQGSNVEDLIAAVERSFGRDGIRLLALPPKSKPRVVSIGFWRKAGRYTRQDTSKFAPKSSEFGIGGWTWWCAFCIFFANVLLVAPRTCDTAGRASGSDAIYPRCRALGWWQPHGCSFAAAAAALLAFSAGHLHQRTSGMNTCLAIPWFCNKSSSTLCLPFLCFWFFLLFVWSDCQCTSSTCMYLPRMNKVSKTMDFAGASSGHKCKFAHHPEAQDPQGGSPHWIQISWARRNTQQILYKLILRWCHCLKGWLAHDVCRERHWSPSWIKGHSHTYEFSRDFYPPRVI